MRVLVTGGAGFIGSNLTAMLVQSVHSVRVIDDLSTGFASNLEGIYAEFIRSSILDRAALRQAISGVDAIVQLAAMVSVPRSTVEPMIAHEVNDTGTLVLLQTARELGVKNIVFASTCAVYGDNEEQPKRESMPLEPTSPYASSKAACEMYAGAFAKCYDMALTAMRFFNVYGPKQDPSSPYSGVMSKFLSAAASDRKVVVFGDGSQTRDFVFVEDVCRALVLALETAAAGFRVFNVASGTSSSLNEVLDAIQEITAMQLDISNEAFRVGEIIHSSADTSAAQSGLGFEAQIGLREGLDRTYRWFVQ